jgi:LPS export ABC transporter protein LptC
MMMATAAAVAFIVYSCKGKLSEAEKLNLSETPVQSVEDMFFVQTENGSVRNRIEAPLMERYESDTMTIELFPKGVNVYGYEADGKLETIITADAGRHDRFKKTGEEKWSAYGNAVVRNVIKQERMETDTLYWDRAKKEIYTHCYVKMSSPKGYMQGYGMRSDEMARNAIILRPFDSYGLMKEDSTKVLIDSANFIGPLLKNSAKSDKNY